MTGPVLRVARLALAIGLVSAGAGCGSKSPSPETASGAAPSPPPRPADGTPDSLLGLFIMPAESLAPYERREHGYEEESAVVYGEADRWLLLGLADGGRRWVSRSAGQYLPMDTLLQDRLSYLTDAWDRTLHAAPDPGSDLTRFPHPLESGDGPPTRLLQTRITGGRLWLEVELLDDVCTVDTSRVIGRGWVPAWTGGEVTMWYWSRGC